MKKLKYLFLLLLSFTFFSFSPSVNASENETFYSKVVLGRFANDDWVQVGSKTSNTNELLLNSIYEGYYYPIWLGFYGNASNNFTTDKIYNLSFKVSYPSGYYFDWKEAMQYAKMEVTVDNIVINYCTMNSNTTTSSEFTCEFKVSQNGGSYYEINVNWWDTNLSRLDLGYLLDSMPETLRFDLSLTSNTDYGGQLVTQNEVIIGQNQQIIDSNNETNNIIKNDDVSGVENAFENFEGFIAENSTITQLITMPITLYTSILNGMQATCQPFVLGDLLGTNLTIPCINIGNYLGSVLWSMIDIIISGFAIFSISKKLIKIFNNFSSMKEGDVIND